MLQIIKHRVNRIAELYTVDQTWGVEVDLRSDVNRSGKIHLSHDPWSRGDDFEDWLSEFCNLKIAGPILLNTKEDGLEEHVMRLLKARSLENFAFLDTAFPTLVRWVLKRGESRFAVRLSKYEPLAMANAFLGKVDWIWLDCFDGDPWMDCEFEFLSRHSRICLVSPELQGAEEKFGLFANVLPLVDAICTKKPESWRSLPRKTFSNAMSLKIFVAFIHSVALLSFGSATRCVAAELGSNEPCASQTSEILSESVYRIRFVVDPKESHQYEKILDQSKDVVRGVVRMMSELVSSPGEIVVTFTHRESEAVTDSNRLVVPFQFLKKSPKGKSLVKHPKYTHAVIAHELGHLFFNRLMDLEPSAWYGGDFQNFRQKTMEIRKQRNQDAKARYDVLDAELAKIKENNLVRAREVESEMRAISKRMGDQGLIGMLSGRPLDVPYSELFADLVSVLYIGDLAADRDSSFFSGDDKQSHDAAELRDFSRHFEIQGWSKGEEHSTLAPTRSYLGAILKSLPRSHSAKSRFLKNVAKCIALELRDRFEHELFDLTPEEVNRRLVDRMQAILAH